LLLEVRRKIFGRYPKRKGERALKWEQAVQALKENRDLQDLVRACYYDEPIIKAAQRFTESEEWQEIKKILHDWIPGKVLDLGAGHGISSYAFVRTGCAVTALEPDSSPVVGTGAIKNLAQVANLDITIVQALGEDLPFADASFDIVYGRQILHHAGNLLKLCQEAARVLKPSGVFISTREHVISRPEDLAKFLLQHPLHASYGGENAFLLAQYCNAIYQAGLDLRKKFGPYESVINYFPLTKKEMTERVAAGLKKYFGTTTSDWLSCHSGLQSLICRCRSWLDNTPGRLYSFVAIKSNV
jgi:SAM-dependent methyltransferase